MATKDKKLLLGRRQQTASPSPRDNTGDRNTISDAQRNLSSRAKTASAASKTPLVRKLARGQTKKNQKKIALKLNPRAKRKAAQKITKSLMNTARVLDAKKLLKNGKMRQRKAKEEMDDGPPVLEPIFPIEDNLEKKPRKSRVVRNPAARKVKIEPEDTAVNSDSSVSSCRNSKKTRLTLKTESVDTVTETIEGVISGAALTPDQIKKEPDSLSESSRSDIIKPKKLTKKQKLLLLKKEIKKENIENAITDIGPNDQKVIDMLDLNVLKVKKTYPSQKRRHTIEKYPMGSDISNSDDFSQFSLFSSLPRSNSPKSKRKVRGSIEGKVINPYTIRSTTRLLRNGKQRKLKQHLFDGLDITKKKKRLCSDYASGEISKLSGYDSDSSFSDMASMHGADTSDSKEIVVKKEFLDHHSGASSTIDCEIKRRLSLDNAYCTDTNSNVCDDLKVIDHQKSIRDNPKDVVLLGDDVYPSPSIKVPEKLLILDIMKQTFNETILETENKTSTDESTEDLLPVEPEEKESEEKKMSEIISKIVETMGNEEFTATINTTDEGTALVMQNGDIRDNSSWDDSTSMLEPTQETSVNAPVENSDESLIAKDQSPLLNHANEMEDIPMNVDETEMTVTEDIPVDDHKGSEYASFEDQSEAIGETEEMNIEEPIETAPVDAITEEQIVEDDLPKEPQHEDQKEVSPPKVVSAAPVEPEQENEATIQPMAELAPVPMELEEPQPSTSKDGGSKPVILTEEEVAIKESILKALGLQSLRAAEEAKLKEKDKAPARIENYTGTLKTVIKLNRDTGKKKGKNQPLKMTLQKNKSKSGDGSSGSQDDYKIMKEGCSSWKNSGQSSDTAGAHRKSHYSNRSNPDGSSEHTSDGEVPNPEAPAKALVIPEKASSFAFHPCRLCKDECSYCFGKFGLFDTPCHIAQIKSVERQDKILSFEKHLTRDSCLCDACYRHIDRKANTPSYVSKSFKRGPLIAPGPKENHCHVLACNNVSTNVLRRKWIIKMKKQICQVINIDLDNPGLHSIPICDEHYVALEHLMVCAMCKRRLARNHIHYIGPEVDELNAALIAEDIPMKLSDKPVVCKLCKCFATILLRNSEEKPDNFEDFFVEYKKRLLHFNNIVPMDEASAEEPIVAPMKDRSDKEQTKKKRKLSKNQTNESSQPGSPSSEDKPTQSSSGNEQANSISRPDSPSDCLVDYNCLIPSIAMDCEDSEPTNEMAKISVGTLKRMPKLESLSKAVDITAVRDHNGDLAMQRLGSNPSLSVRQLFPGEEDLGFQGDIDFGNVREKTQEGWEKCNLLLQYDKESKQLWQELQKPYGNHSSFFRHLIMLEKYFRKGQLELVPDASPQAVKYTMSVQNRLRAYDNIPAGASKPFNIIGLNTSKSVNSISHKDVPVAVTQTSVPGIPVLTSSNVSVTAVRPTSVTITQIGNSVPIRPLMPVTITKAKPAYPPGLISLHPGTNRPVAPLVKQSTKIKFPITKNWRPTLIPIDPTAEKKMGLVQVISGGKPFHITLEDYKKMCAIKRSFENKQKRQQDAQKRATKLVASGSSILMSNKSLTISKTSIAPKQELESRTDIGETILDKLDQQVENLESKFNESMIGMPKIPKSLTVIPQTVARKTSRPASPVLLITQKPGGSKS
ncbi:hypothetical protein WA026_009510 [Henosepilachna vigintioctopunctata]|uniref:Uncharacterized protein n=1 Tax=Henosepilachna vigintioctopunctata TaxID=420089 RepID=A0AAW1U3Z1_9CUCU